MNNSWCCQRTFQYIIESFFPHTRLGCAAYHHNPPGDPMGPVNKDFVAYAFLASMRHVSSWRAPSQRQPGSKFRVLRDAVLNNPFVGPCQREVLLARFSKAQRIYMRLSAAARTRKMARARVARADHDMFLRPLADLPPCATTEIYDDDSRTIYKFRLSDLLRLIKAALCTAPDFFVDPQPVRNPYTGQPFTTAQLYTLYGRIRQSAYEIPTVFHMYRAGGFSTRCLVDRAEAFIREEAIDAVRGAHDDQRTRYVTRMLRDYHEDLQGLTIHPRFPNTQLLATFGRFLPTYLRTTLSMHPDLQTRSRLRLHAELSRFVASHPMYGRPRLGDAPGELRFHSEAGGNPVAATPRSALRRLVPLLEAVGIPAAVRNAQIEGSIMREAGQQVLREAGQQVLREAEEQVLREAGQQVLREAEEQVDAAHEEQAEAEMEHAVTLQHEYEMQQQAGDGEHSSEEDSDDERPDSPPRPAAMHADIDTDGGRNDHDEVTYVPAQETADTQDEADAFDWLANPPPVAGSGMDTYDGSDEGVAPMETDAPLIHLPAPAPVSPEAPAPLSPRPAGPSAASPPPIPRLQAQPPNPPRGTLGPSRIRTRGDRARSHRV